MSNKNKKEPPECGSFRHAFNMRIKDPREFYNMRLEYLRKKKHERNLTKRCIMCGGKAKYTGRKHLKRIYFCEKCKKDYEKNKIKV